MYRSRTNNMIGGVCYGISEHFQIDPTITRLLTVFLTFMSFGFFVLLYFFLWIILPEEDAVKYDNFNHSDAQSTNTSFNFENRYDEKQTKSDFNSNTYENVNTSVDDSQTMEKNPSSKEHSRKMLAIFLIGFGTLVLLDNLIPQKIMQMKYIFPIFLIVLGFIMIIQGSDKHEHK